jgi:hypothetical protein
VERRLETTLERINDRYSAVIAPAGLYKVDDIIPNKNPAQSVPTPKAPEPPPKPTGFSFDL